LVLLRTLGNDVSFSGLGSRLWCFRALLLGRLSWRPLEQGVRWPHRRRADSNFVLVYSLVGWRWSSSSPRSERTIDVDRPLSSYGVGFDNSGFAEQADYDGQRRPRDEKCGSRSGSAEFGDPPRNPAISRRRVESVLFQGISTFYWFVFASHRHHIPNFVSLRLDFEVTDARSECRLLATPCALSIGLEHPEQKIGALAIHAIASLRCPWQRR
jgi:hypothetical protein